MLKQELKQLSKWWNGAHNDHNHLSIKNLVNFILFVVALIPSIIFVSYVYSQQDIYLKSTDASSKDSQNTQKLENWKYFYDQLINKNASLSLSQIMFWNPLILINFLFFVNIDIGFWIVGLIQKSFWLIDPYWSIIPILYGFMWAIHPLAIYNARSVVALILVIIWGIRLTHSYFRREGWKFGVQEDWRYTKMAFDYGQPAWYFISFFVVGVAQHPMVVGISLPLYSVCFGPTAFKDWSYIDSIIVVFCLSGILIAFISDNQLRAFVQENKKRKQQNEAIIPILQTGLWKYSRHPNYFGEQLWWWSFGMFSVNCGQPLCILGTFINSIVLFIVTDMTEKKMLKEWDEDRAKLFIDYQKRTSPCIPWFSKDSVNDEHIQLIQKNNLQ